MRNNETKFSSSSQGEDKPIFRFMKYIRGANLMRLVGCSAKMCFGSSAVTFNMGERIFCGAWYLSRNPNFPHKYPNDSKQVKTQKFLMQSSLITK
jgi:hypothetical protein